MASEPLNAGLQFVLADGTLDRGKIEAVARTRAVNHAARYASDDAAYRGELSGVHAQADGELQIWAARARVGLITINPRDARELSTDGPLPKEAA